MSSGTSNFDEHDEGFSLLLSRRQFLYGTLGVGALVLASSHTAFSSPAFADTEEFNYLTVSKEDVFTLQDCTEVPPADAISLVGEFKLPYGTLIWTSGDSLAACLLPTETSRPLTKLGVLFLTNGEYRVLLESSVGASEGFEIYDVRNSDQGFVWTEANILSGVWRIYAAAFSGGTLEEPYLLEEGDGNWDTPTIAAVKSNAFWQILPKASGVHLKEDSLLKRASFGTDSSEVVYRSEGRMSSPPYPLHDSLVITPRTSSDAVHHQLVLLDGDSGETRDALVLPQSMKPLEAGYGTTGFTFSFDGIYENGEGISNLGTYTPQSSHDAFDYENKSWFRFNKTPSGPPAWSKNHFLVKSTRSVCGVDLENKSYYAIDVISGSDSYGDYLASSGENDSFVTFSNVHSKPFGGEEEKFCLVRVWKPLV